jgi:spoIIIJ-associated protein
VNDSEVLVLEASSVEEARRSAAEKWGVQPDEVAVKVIEEEKSFFGLLGRKLRVEIRPSAPLPLLRGRVMAGRMLDAMNLHINLELRDDSTINLTGQDAGIIIGRYGETLKSMEFLLNLMARGVDEGGRIFLDSDGYRERRELSLQRLALAAASKTVKRGRPTYLEPMTSWERRVIHMALKDDSSVETKSVGETPSRKVVVWPAKRPGRRRD